MTEDLLHFLWMHSPASLNGLTTTQGDAVEVIAPGEHNHDAGPDFFNAKVRIGGTVWAGNVEIHLRASDWARHGHATNPDYDSVVLHVVAQADGHAATSSRGEPIPTLPIPYPDQLAWALQRLVGSGGWIPCAEHLPRRNPFATRMWLTGLCIERLEQKTQLVLQDVQACGGSWEEAFYRSLARSLGLRVNALPFELLAKATPLRVLARGRDNLQQVEALLFGQAGMLAEPPSTPDPYHEALRAEYQYQQRKHGLEPIPAHLWKFLRLRPVAFPTIRIAQLAMLIHRSSGLFSQLMEAEGFAQIAPLLRVGCSPYWDTHYRFGRPSAPLAKALGSDTVATLTLNSIVPFLFAYGAQRAQQPLKDRAVALLEQLKPEANAVTRGFERLGITPDSAFFTQALVQLKTLHCDRRKCLFCPVGVEALLKPGGEGG